jgi:acetyl-CoA carboxylase biotin carboxyl carrier protein
VDLTSDDVQDILRLLDGLPFGEMHLQTARFSLWLRRGADGEWTQETRILPEPAVIPAASRPAEAAADTAAVPRSGEVAADTPGAPRSGEVAADTPGGPRSREVAAGADGQEGTAGASRGAAPAGPPPVAEAPEPDGLRAVRAPLPGTFYRAPMPGAPPFVDVGSRVEPDTVVGIVETMKLMNSVSAGARGTVEQIPLANAQFAERDAVLMWIREHS